MRNIGWGMCFRYALITVGCCFMAYTAWYTEANSFRPATSLKSWYTSREPLDIELIATTSFSAGERKLEPARSMRLRMERAYVALLLSRAHSPAGVLRFSLDMPTGLPASLLSAARDDQSRRKDPLLPAWETHKDFLERQLDITFSSEAIAEHLSEASPKLASCAGEALGDDLITVNRAEVEYCQILSLDKRNKYLARYTDDLLLLISCQPAPVQRCDSSFPYEGFAAKVSFGEMHLRSWRLILRTATEFLRKNQFKAEQQPAGQ